MSTDFDYAINTGRAVGFNQNVPLWNAGVAYQIFKKKNGEIKLTVNDLLNQNSNIDRTVRDNYIEDTRTVILQRYFLLTFTYNFNQFGKRGQGNKSGEREFQMNRGERGQQGGGGQRGGGQRGGGTRNNF